jgi:hypothetical protein
VVFSGNAARPVEPICGTHPITPDRWSHIRQNGTSCTRADESASPYRPPPSSRPFIEPTTIDDLTILVTLIT